MASPMRGAVGGSSCGCQKQAPVQKVNINTKTVAGQPPKAPQPKINITVNGKPMGQASPAASAPKPASAAATPAGKTTSTGANGQKLNHYTFNVKDGTLVKAQTGLATPTPTPAATAPVKPSISAETEAESQWTPDE